VFKVKDPALLNKMHRREGALSAEKADDALVVTDIQPPK
jgi:hypothetical protein